MVVPQALLCYHRRQCMYHVTSGNERMKDKIKKKKKKKNKQTNKQTNNGMKTKQ